MSEHTPGSWEVNELIPDGTFIKRSGTYEIATDDYDVATFVPHGGPFRKYADAVLASAAPDMYAVCQGDNEAEDIWLSEFQRIAGPDAALSDTAQTRLHQLRQQRYAAIAKAEGRE